MNAIWVDNSILLLETLSEYALKSPFVYFVAIGVVWLIVGIFKGALKWR